MLVGVGVSVGVGVTVGVMVGVGVNAGRLEKLRSKVLLNKLNESAFDAM